MKLVTSTNIYFERKYEPFIQMSECLELCAQAGFEQLDFGFAELVLVSKKFISDAWQEEILAYKKIAERRNMAFIQAHATIFDFCNPNEAYEQQELLFQKSIVGASMLGASWIVVHPSTGIKNGVVHPDTHKKNVAFFQKYGEFASQYGIGLAIENMWGKTRSGIPQCYIQPEEILRLIEDIKCDKVKVCWDVEHGSIEQLNQTEGIRMLGEHIVATHISDEAGVDNIHILPYLGKADWDEILGALADINYNGTFDFEIQHFLPGVPKELIPSAMKFSFEVGNFMIQKLEHLKEERGFG